MPFLLSIDTATEHASVCITNGDTLLEIIESTEQKNHAAFVQPAISLIMEKSGLRLKDIDAVAVTAGPGSYTGLRVGLASAKGICYALQKPLLHVNTLEVMAQAVRSNHSATSQAVDPLSLLCPMIDARRMEVFTAVYDLSLQEIQAPHALILDAMSFRSLLSKRPVIFTGTGQQKLRGLLADDTAVFADIQHNASHLAIRALPAYQSRRFADLAYCEPLYVKEFFNPAPPRR